MYSRKVKVSCFMRQLWVWCQDQLVCSVHSVNKLLVFSKDIHFCRPILYLKPTMLRKIMLLDFRRVCTWQTEGAYCKRWSVNIPVAQLTFHACFSTLVSQTMTLFKELTTAQLMPLLIYDTCMISRCSFGIPRLLALMDARRTQNKSESFAEEWPFEEILRCHNVWIIRLLSCNYNFTLIHLSYIAEQSRANSRWFFVLSSNQLWTLRLLGKLLCTCCAL